MNRRRGLNHAETMATSLSDCGVGWVFGLPGGEIAAFIEACRRADMRVVLTGHENSAALIAQVMGQITGTPAVCFATLGPGATNLATGMANAFLDRAPLLAVTAQIPHSSYASLTHQRIAVEKMFAPITKRSTVIGDRDSCELVRECISLAIEPRPGPVMLVLPSDVANQRCPCSDGKIEPSKKRSQVQHEDSLLRLRDRIAHSERPLFLIGLGTPMVAASAVRTLVETLQAPFLVTPKVKGILPEDHPLFLGVASGMAMDRDILETIRMADLIVGVGFDPVEADKTWFTETECVAVDSVSMAEGDYHPLEAIGNMVSLAGDLAGFIEKPCPWPDGLLEERRQVLHRVPRTSGGRVSPLGLIQGLRSTFPRNGIVTCDVGSHKLLMGQFWRSYEPGTFFMSNGLSGMGFGIPAAIAAQLVYPERAVMSVVGDGGMLMMAHDLVLIRELQLPIIIVVLADNSLSLIRISQERRGYPPCAVDFCGPRFDTLADAFGIRGEKATTIAEAQLAVERALEHQTSLLLEVPVDLQEYYELV
jgi:acetolactate synthase-1/2/3 large subunit